MTLRRLRKPGDKELGCRFAHGFNLYLPPCGGNQQSLSASEWRHQVALDFELASYDSQNQASILVLNPLPALDIPSVEHELLAGNEAGDVRLVSGLSRCGLDRAASIVNRLHAVFDVQGARVAVDVEAAPIRETKGVVAHLLDFGHEKSRPNSMDGPRRNEYAVSRLWLDAMKQTLDIALSQSLLHHISIDRLSKTSPQATAGRCLDDVPGFGFSRVGKSHFRGAPVIGMHLQGEMLIGIKVLQEQRKNVLGVVLSEKSLASGFAYFSQSFALKRPCHYDALALGMVGNFPALGIDSVGGEFAAQSGFEASAAPQVVLVDRVKSEGIEIGHRGNSLLVAFRVRDTVLPGGVFVVGSPGRWYDGNLLAVGKYTPEGARWAGPPTPLVLPSPPSPDQSNAKETFEIRLLVGAWFCPPLRTQISDEEREPCLEKDATKTCFKTRR